MTGAKQPQCVQGLQLVFLRLVAAVAMQRCGVELCNLHLCSVPAVTECVFMCVHLVSCACC